MAPVWLLEHVALVGPYSVRLLRRELPSEVAELRNDLEPFFVESCLVRARIEGVTTSGKGRIRNVTADGTRWTFDVESPGVTRGLILNDVSRRQLTVWRIDERLDALQVLLASTRDWGYFQLGGAALLSAFANQIPISGELYELIRLFRESSEPD